MEKNLISKLLWLSQKADELGIRALAAEGRSLAERADDGRFYVAFVGQFKRGKSTLIDALVGEPILPAGILPVTSVATIVRYGETRAVRVHTQQEKTFEAGIDRIAEFVSEERNPENSKGISGVEVFVPAKLLAGGMCLVDTPGLGSVFAGNSAATHALVPHIDAAVLVLGADPPISGEELALAQAIAQETPHVLLVLNKADRTTEEERRQASEFALRVLQADKRGARILQVSAQEQLGKRNSRYDWQELARALSTLERESSAVLLQQAVNRGQRRIASRLLRLIAEERDALLRPLVQSEERIKRLQRISAHLSESLSDLSHLLTGEQQRLAHKFAIERELFLKNILQEAHEELAGTLGGLSRTSGPAFRRSVMRKAQDVARKALVPWLETAQGRAEQAYEQAMTRFTQMANEFVARTAELDASGGSVEGLVGEKSFQNQSRFYYNDLIEIAAPASPLVWLVDSALACVGGYGVLEKKGHEFLARLLETNSARVESDLNQRVADSRRRLEREVRALLEETLTATMQALSRVREIRSRGEAAVESRLSQLDTMKDEIASQVS